MAKRVLDTVLSLATIIGLLPVYVVLAAAIKLASKDPVLFRQERAGRYGRPFMLYKFRTMRTDADPFGPSPRSGQDQRLTRIGRFLREYSLDELPQLSSRVI